MESSPRRPSSRWIVALTPATNGWLADTSETYRRVYTYEAFTLAS